MGTLKIMGQKGDQKVAWDPSDKDQVSKARAKFNQLVVNMKYLAFRMGPDGKKGDQIKEFDENAGSILLIPAMQGGA